MTDPAPPDPADPPRPARGLAGRLPLVLVLAGAILGTVLLRDSLTFEALAANRERLIALRDAHMGLVVAGFVLSYALAVALSLPGGAIFSLAGGFLFGLFPGVVYNVAGAATGAVAVFLAVRAGIGADLARRMASGGGAAARLQAGLRENEWSVLLTMRLLPVVPFFVANLLPAFLGAAPHRFAVTTVVGIIPGALVFTSAGAGLGTVFAAGGEPDLSLVMAPPVLLPMLGLAALALLPVAVRAWRGRRA